MQQPIARPGTAYPLGATLIEGGVNFAIFSHHASAVELCLFEGPGGAREVARVPLRHKTDGVWHAALPGLKAGQLYGFRVHGAYQPESGHFFDASKLLLDPYARAITGPFDWCDELFGSAMSGTANPELQKDSRDSAGAMPKCVVVDGAFDWGADRPPATAFADSVIYEVHVKGFSKLATALPEELRGTYAAMGSDWAITQFQRLGVTAVELLPVQHFVNDRFLEEKALTNYWGYNPIGFFAPHAMYAASGRNGAQVTEFKAMVRNLHAAGIEVILDVVFNHTGEGGRYGPTLAFRGIDNASYYRSAPNNPGVYVDYTGCGNTLNAPHPRVLQLIMDSLRYWVLEMHVDGFRFDLASTLAREDDGRFDRGAAFFDVVRQDPVLARVKLIAEPWDLGPGSYQVGNFPPPFAEWNGKYRDTVRSFWKGDGGTVREFGHRIAGSPDLYAWAERTPAASINFVTAHDGFTLTDLVSYNDKHNEANGEENRDGENHNRAWNCGVEGPSDEPEICVLRRRQRRNFLATLFLSQGVPMLCAGDEYGRSQGGNNNAYCQDNELSWLAWERTVAEQQCETFVTRLIAFRQAHAAFRRLGFFGGKKSQGAKVKEIVSFHPDGREMPESDWTAPSTNSVAVSLVGGIREGHEAEADGAGFLIVFNAHHEPLRFCLAGRRGVRWECLLDTREESGFLDVPTAHLAGEEFELAARSMCLFRLSGGLSEDARSESAATGEEDEFTLPSAEPLGFGGHA